MLYLEYACDMMTSQALCPVAINKYYQRAEECFCVQSILQLLFFIDFLYFIPKQHREMGNEVNSIIMEKWKEQKQEEFHA
jgi:hypothetical protein